MKYTLLHRENIHAFGVWRTNEFNIYKFFQIISVDYVDN